MTNGLLLLDDQVNSFDASPQFGEPAIPVYDSVESEPAKHGATSKVIAGMQRELCVAATCRAGAKLGYAITLVADAHSTLDAQNESAAEIIARANREWGDVASVILATEIHFAS